MKKIGIAAHYLCFAGRDRQMTTASLSDHCIDEGVMPIMLFFPTRIDDIAHVSTYVSDVFDELELDGVILQGGDDVSADMYLEKDHVSAEYAVRDIFERCVVQEAIHRNMPIFAICRGMQLLNVVLGGTLLQELQDVPYAHLHMKRKDVHGGFSPDNMEALEHEVELTSDGVLASIYNRSRITVNSYHHQAVDQIAPSLQIEAVSTDGIVEALSDGAHILALQWHPELPIGQHYDWTPLTHWISNL